MADFNNAVDSAKKYFDAAAAKTGEVLENSKLHLERSQIKSRINALYTRLGRAYYATLQGNSEEEALIDKILKQLEGAMSDLTDIEVLIANSKSIRCPVCGKKNSANTDYCKDCGTSLYDDEEI